MESSMSSLYVDEEATVEEYILDILIDQLHELAELVEDDGSTPS